MSRILKLYQLELLFATKIKIFQSASKRLGRFCIGSVLAPRMVRLRHKLYLKKECHKIEKLYF